MTPKEREREGGGLFIFGTGCCKAGGLSIKVVLVVVEVEMKLGKSCLILLVGVLLVSLEIYEADGVSGDVMELSEGGGCQMRR